MKKWNVVIDIARCHDCNNCFLACKDEHWDNDYPPYTLGQPRHGHRWIDILYKERGQFPKVDPVYLPLMCMHCDNAPCVARAQGGEVYKRDDGIVLIDPEKAKGKKEILDYCPYGVIFWNEEKEVPQKCTLCAHLLAEGWKEPRCVQVCPTGALRVLYVEDEEMARIREAEGLTPYRPELNTKPRVYYKNLYKWERCFIAGSVALGAKDECAAGARVVLTKGEELRLEAVADCFGDFLFDNLVANGGKYRLEVEYEGYQREVREVELETSLNIGTIFLWQARQG